MADYYSPTVIQPTIPMADMTPLERLLLSHVFSAEADGDGLYFSAEEMPAQMIFLARAELEAALAESQAESSAINAVVAEQLSRVPPDQPEIDLDLTTDIGWERIFQDIVRRSPTQQFPLSPAPECGPTASAAWRC